MRWWLGQSFGGYTAAAVAALNPPVLIFINAGGRGMKTMHRSAVRAIAGEKMFQDYVRFIPSLWVYASGCTLADSQGLQFNALSGGGNASWCSFHHQGDVVIVYTVPAGVAIRSAVLDAGVRLQWTPLMSHSPSLPLTPRNKAACAPSHRSFQVTATVTYEPPDVLLANESDC
jgi:hypothetical protein